MNETVKLGAPQISILRKIVMATHSAEGYLFMSEKKSKQLVDKGLVEVNVTMTEDDNPDMVATRATPDGVDWIDEKDNSLMTASKGEEDDKPPTWTFDNGGNTTPQYGPGPSDDEQPEEEVSKGVDPTALFDDDVPVPAKRYRTSGTKYNLESMKPGQSLHIAVTEERPNPSRSLASTVSSVNKRFTDSEGNRVRQYSLYTVGTEDPRGPGARIFRIK